MSNRFGIILLVIGISITLLTGCWDRRELEELFVAYSMGIDISKENPDLLSLSLSGPAVEEKTEKPQVSIISQGTSIQDAAANIQSKLYREIVFGHVQVLLIGEDTARDGITAFLDAFDRNPDVRGTLHLAITKGRAQEIITAAQLPQHPYIGIFSKGLLEGVHRESIAHNTTIREFYRSLDIEGIDPCMAYLSLSPDKDQIASNHIAVFQDDRFMGILDKDESIAAMILMERIRQGRVVIRLPHSGNMEFHDSSAAYIDRGRRSITTHIEDGQVKIGIDIKITARLAEYTPPHPTLSRNSMEIQNHLFEEKLKKDIEKTLKQLQEYQADIVGFGERVRTKYPNFFDKNRWREDFSKAKFDVNVKFQIRELGAAS